METAGDAADAGLHGGPALSADAVRAVAIRHSRGMPVRAAVIHHTQQPIRAADNRYSRQTPTTRRLSSSTRKPARSIRYQPSACRGAVVHFFEIEEL
ncbi:hypothetical protein KNP414_07726 [Paenibacillus mucilaginosus KNP414]|uniref:Uncharacterized protein n=1 Tax=Paenibacillus mucilaginosus (strain KNP414) TaxID=1036673 RepID=F8FEX7_PAEMK|nr:hypothetical protein KNP414_07726 [Paenibacillus mucilaginosus KNP414]